MAPSELLAAMAGGDPRALDTLYKAWSRKVRVFAYAKLVHSGLDAHAIAGEVTIDVFHDVWRHPLRYDGRVEFATWLLTLTRNKTIDQIRRHGKRVAVEDAFDELADPQRLFEGGAETATDPQTLQERAQRGAAVRHCLQLLRNPLQRESLTLWALDEMSILDIARVQGAPEGTVKTRLLHGRLNLRKCMVRWFAREGNTHG